MTQQLLEITNLSAHIGERSLLDGFSLSMAQGSVHALMGQNGAGKSSIAHILAGKPEYKIDHGFVQYMGEDLLELNPEERSHRGIFLAFQYPIVIGGLSTSLFLRHAYNAKLRYLGEKELDPMGFVKILRPLAKELGLSDEMLRRPLNDGFSGGEKKRLEILQMNLLNPKLVILDEVDSGLDVSALKLVADNINQMRAKGLSLLMITHYQRLLDYIEPDFVHILHKGRIAKTGSIELARALDAQGYEAIL